jgi:FkbM family methyltransferase
MLIDFRELFPKYGINPTGVCHIGANVAEEFSVYMELGIEKQMWIEANPEIYLQLTKNIASNPKAIAFNYCAGDETKAVVLHISNNAGQSSSILDLETHKTAHPEVHYIGDVTVPMIRMENLLTDFYGDLDFLNIDIQGAELLALKGLGERLHQFKWAYLEINKEPLYAGCALVEEIDAYLEKFGFLRVETKWAGTTGWGDALYIKEKKHGII